MIGNTVVPTLKIKKPKNKKIDWNKVKRANEIRILPGEEIKVETWDNIKLL